MAGAQAQIRALEELLENERKTAADLQARVEALEETESVLIISVFPRPKHCDFITSLHVHA